ncbi:MAG: YqgE/AlgH family protein [Acidimicrobiia bacterium]|nr:YqgE/AlgH family protein [Acidimicrobiia bacterium]
MNVSGKLLVAVPALTDPNFHQAVVFVIEHTPDGSFGVILNRPTELAVGDPLPGAAASEPAVVFDGGPVLREGALAIGRAVPETIGWTPFASGPAADIGMVDVERALTVGWPDMVALRVYSGHSGWSAGQLDAEVAEDGWVVAEASAADLFTPTPEDLYRVALERAGTAPQLSRFIPPDPSLN